MVFRLISTVPGAEACFEIDPASSCPVQKSTVLDAQTLPYVMVSKVCAQLKGVCCTITPGKTRNADVKSELQYNVHLQLASVQ